MLFETEKFGIPFDESIKFREEIAEQSFRFALWNYDRSWPKNAPTSLCFRRHELQLHKPAIANKNVHRGWRASPGKEAIGHTHAGKNLRNAILQTDRF